MKPLEFIHQTKAQPFLALVILIGGGLLIGFCHMNDTATNRIFDVMFLSATYYYGSNKGSTTKDETINSLTKK